MAQVNTVIAGCATALEGEGFNAREVNTGVDICLYQLDEKLRSEVTSSARTRSAGDKLPLEGLCTKSEMDCDPKTPFR